MGSFLEDVIDAGDAELLGNLLEALDQSGTLKVAGNLILDQGTCLQMLNIAARAGDGALAGKVWDLIDEKGFPLSASLYNASMQAFALAKRDRSVFMAMKEMHDLGYTPSRGTLKFVAQQLSSSVSRLDAVFNELVEMKERGDAVTAPMLYTVLLGCAYAGQLDRAFATFEDYQGVFGISNDLESCNALLFAIDRSSKTLSQGAAMSVLQEMMDLGIPLNAESFHLTISALTKSTTDQHAKVFQVLGLLKQSGLAPKPETLRTLALWSALRGEHDKAQGFVHEMKTHQYHVPNYLVDRLERIKERGDQLYEVREMVPPQPQEEPNRS